MIIRNCKLIGKTQDWCNIYEVEVVTNRFFVEKCKTARIRMKTTFYTDCYYWEETGEELSVDERLAFYKAKRILQFKEDKIKEVT